MQRGTIKWFNEDKGYGFITGDDGADVFVHIKAVDDEAALVEGAAVQYETEEGPKGIRAKAVKLVAMLLLVCVAFMAGCSDLQARGPMAVTIDTNAYAAAEIRPQALVGALTVDQCIVTLAENSAKFDCYALARTTNWFAYAFGDKTIWCSPTYAVLIDKTAALAYETKTQATTRPAAWCNMAVVKESNVLIKVKQAKDGKKE